MLSFRRVGVSRRLALVFTVILTVLLAVAVAASLHLIDVQRSVRAAADQTNLLARATQIERRAMHVTASLNPDSWLPRATNDAFAQNAATVTALQNLRRRPGVTPGMRADIDEAIAALGKLRRLEVLFQRGVIPRQQAAVQARAVTADLERVMQRFSGRVLTQARIQRDSLLRGSDAALIIALTASTLLILGCATLFVMLTRSVARPLEDLERGMLAWMRGGEVSTAPRADADDELARISRTFAAFAIDLRTALDDVRATIAEQQAAVTDALARVSAQAQAMQRAEGQATEAALDAASGLMATDRGLGAVADMRAAAGGAVAISDQLGALASHLQRVADELRAEGERPGHGELMAIAGSIADHATGFRDAARLLCDSADECASTVSQTAVEKEDLAASLEELTAHIAESNAGLIDAEHSAEEITRVLARLERAIARLPG